MSKSNVETIFTIERLWAAAIIMHKETWFEAKTVPNAPTDLCIFEDFKNASIDAVPQKFNEFLTDYKIARNIPVRNRREFFLSVKQATINWHDLDIVEKARKLNTLNITAKMGRGTRTIRPRSAASKTAWMLRPIGWTLYDSRASSALGNKNFIGYYKCLKDLKIELLFEKMRPLMKGNWANLYPERIVDKSLFILGSLDSYKNISQKISTEATEIGEVIGNLPAAKSFNDHLRERTGIV